jgi:tripartite-type tricarboxylate transporter receptor subunit TctC
MKLLAVLSLLTIAQVSMAQTPVYPSGPIKIIVPVTPGGTVDTITRVVAAGLQSALGQSVVVENRTGGSGVPATLAAIRAQPDGYTLFMGTIGTVGVNPHLTRNPLYDPLRDLVPISLVGEVPSVLTVSVSSPFNSVGDLIQYAKAHPGELNFGSPGNGTSPHMAAELFAQRAGINIAHVPYPGASQAYIDMFRGQVHLYFDNIITALPQIKGGKIKALATVGSKRSRFLPDLPTIDESGVPGYEVTGWLGLMAPVGTPDAIIQQLSSELQKILRTPETQAKIVGAEAIGSTPEEFKAYLKAENEKWAAVVKASNIPLN